MTRLQSIAAGSTVDRSKVPFQVHYAFGLNSTQFNFPKIVEVMKTFVKINGTAKLLITTPSKGGIVLSHVKEEKFVDIHLACPREDFFNRALSSHAWVWWHDCHGSNNGSIWELTMLGVVPIFHESSLPYPWCIDYKDYPFVFKNEIELLTILKFLKDNYSGTKVQEALRLSRNLLMKFADGECSNTVRWKLLEEMHEKKLKADMIKFPFHDLLTTLPKSLLLSDVVEVIKKTSDTKKDLGVGAKGLPGMSMFTRDYLRTVLMQMGYKDVGGLENPKLVRSS
jgi:hypothetical protein